ncbi:SCO family protein [Acidisphaera sp. S103]|uniref:SCO family protein n=1 Tax=Acidisphaera sp. S103 TaxID=1747223 RepID=UPI00131C89F1|nr:SCO family protein [Acidisphaera sp. S103]
MIAIVLMILALLCPHPGMASNLSDFAFDQRQGNQVPLATRFIDRLGNAITLGQALEHRPTILAVGYFHCPNLCGLVRNDLMNALSRLDAERPYSLVVLSIDPKETPADAQSARSADIAHFDHPGQTADWHYLTGSAANITAITQAVGFKSRYDAKFKQFLHPAGLVFLTGNGTVSSYLLGVGYQPSDVGLGLTRAANGITARALPILLLCFHYDPTTGRYSLAIMRILQLGAALTVLVIGGTVMLALRRERHPR